MGQCTPQQNAKCLNCGSQIVKRSSQKDGSPTLKHQCLKKNPVLQENFLCKPYNAKLNETKKMMKAEKNMTMKLKVPIDNSMTKFKWIDCQVLSFASQIQQIPLEAIKKGSFQQKMAWFRAKIDKFRKQNEHGCQNIQIDRQKIISSSLIALDGVNLAKQFKISFIGDGAEDAGGGLLRQWMHLCLKQIFSQQLGIFKQSNTEQTAYQLIWNKKASDEASFQALNLLGLIIAKALIEKISLNCPLDRSIIRQLCAQPVHLSDVFSYDKEFYQSWTSILQMNNVEDLMLDGTVQHQFQDGSVEQIEIFTNGKNMSITNQNKQNYVSELINFYCTKNVQCQLQQLQKSLHQFIPSVILSIFQPFEFEMLLNGPVNIDIKDWQKNTLYDGYEGDEKVIKWFWQIVQSYGQQGYKNLLHYCTGSIRVPILGFAKLQSSHGHVKKFSIRKISYNKNNLYPRSYTCFNRLDLPNYSSKQQLQDKLSFIMKVQFTEFGLC